MDANALSRARLFADTVFLPVRDAIIQRTETELAAARATLAARGVSQSGTMIMAIAKNRGDRINEIVLARAKALLEGCEVHGVEIDDLVLHNIVGDTTTMRLEMLAGTKSFMNGQVGIVGLTISAGYRELEKFTAGCINEVKALVERARFKKREPEVRTTTVYHVYGHNARWSINSNDQSLNIVTLTDHDLFARLKEEIITQVSAGTEQTAIVERLKELEEAQHKSTFGLLFTKFMATAANHMTLIAPFVPALAELLQKALSQPET